MSHWTHITACLYLDTDIQDVKIKEVMEQILRDAPQITGSEGNADIFVNPLSGHNVYTSCDCEHCPFGHTRKKVKNGFTCQAPKEYECKEAEFQTSVALTIIGNLRDRFKDQTKEEYSALLKWLKARFRVEMRSCTITDR